MTSIRLVKWDDDFALPIPEEFIQLLNLKEGQEMGLILMPDASLKISPTILNRKNFVEDLRQFDHAATDINPTRKP